MLTRLFTLRFGDVVITGLIVLAAAMLVPPDALWYSAAGAIVGNRIWYLMDWDRIS